MEQPEEFVVPEKEKNACRFKTIALRTETSSEIVLREWLESNGFTMLKSEACVGVKLIDGAPCFISIYVDDLIVFAPMKAIVNDFKQMLRPRFKMKDLVPIHYILV